LARKSGTIHLLITELAMSEGDGLELAHRFRAAHPEIPVLIVSGASPLLRTRRAHDLDHIEFLAKPFHLDELLHKVRTLLDAAVPFPQRKSLCCD
jgi:DNA-binding NtrC family response regulator